MEFFLDNPWVNNVDLAKKVGVSERAVRHWKKHPIWEEIKAKVLLEFFSNWRLKFFIY